MEYRLPAESEIGCAAEERVYAWRILRAQMLRRVATPNPYPGRRAAVIDLISQADDAGLGKIDLIVELADLAAAVMLRNLADPIEALTQVEREILTDHRDTA
ncbi:MAG: hypothetical protein JWR32_1316 [Mycobacterium sp.]|jgi:hypothetical protein|nr:hypothetical protein [Mycobacterium sp.]